MSSEKPSSVSVLWHPTVGSTKQDSLLSSTPHRPPKLHLLHPCSLNTHHYVRRLAFHPGLLPGGYNTAPPPWMLCLQKLRTLSVLCPPFCTTATWERASTSLLTITKALQHQVLSHTTHSGPFSPSPQQLSLQAAGRYRETMQAALVGVNLWAWD